MAMKYKSGIYLRIGSVALGLILLACTGQSPPTPTATSASSPDLMPMQVASDVVDFTLENLTVSLGATITWVNRDAVPHTATQGTGPTAAENAVWDSGSLIQGESFSLTLEQAGTFAYFCAIHPNMQATITVLEAAG